MAHTNPQPPPLMVTDILRIARDVIDEHIETIERAHAPVVAPDLLQAIELAKQLITTRHGTPS